MRTSYLDQVQNKYRAHFFKNHPKPEQKPFLSTPLPTSPRKGKTTWLSEMPPDQYTVESNGCWVCKTTNLEGYGVLLYGEKKKPYVASRIAWRKANPPAPKGKWVIAKCGDKRCCNPEHMELGEPPPDTNMTWEGLMKRLPTLPQLEAMCEKLPTPHHSEMCWSYTKQLSVKDGYPVLLSNDTAGQQIKKLAAKHAWELKSGRQLEEGRSIVRSCHNRFCCNPQHVDDCPSWMSKLLWTRNKNGYGRF